MIDIKITRSGNAQKFLTELTDTLDNPRRLNAAMGSRLEDELNDHFYLRNREPNKRGWEKQGWWNSVAESTALTRVDDDGAEVTIAHDKGFSMRVTGGEIRPREADSLTIPNVEEAYGKSVAEYEQATGRRLFSPRGARWMAYSDDNKNVVLVYFLVKSVTIKADARALPEEDTILTALREEITDYLSFHN